MSNSNTESGGGSLSAAQHPLPTLVLNSRCGLNHHAARHPRVRLPQA